MKLCWCRSPVVRVWCGATTTSIAPPEKPSYRKCVHLLCLQQHQQQKNGPLRAATIKSWSKLRDQPTAHGKGPGSSLCGEFAATGITAWTQRRFLGDAPGPGQHSLAAAASPSLTLRPCQPRDGLASWSELTASLYHAPPPGSPPGWPSPARAAPGVPCVG